MIWECIVICLFGSSSPTRNGEDDDMFASATRNLSWLIAQSIQWFSIFPPFSCSVCVCISWFNRRLSIFGLQLASTPPGRVVIVMAVVGISGELMTILGCLFCSGLSLLELHFFDGSHTSFWSGKEDPRPFAHVWMFAPYPSIIVLILLLFFLSKIFCPFCVSVSPCRETVAPITNFPSMPRTCLGTSRVPQ